MTSKIRAQIDNLTRNSSLGIAMFKFKILIGTNQRCECYSINSCEQRPVKGITTFNLLNLNRD
jgi:hypothetical protein